MHRNKTKEKKVRTQKYQSHITESKANLAKYGFTQSNMYLFAQKECNAVVFVVVGAFVICTLSSESNEKNRNHRRQKKK